MGVMGYGKRGEEGGREGRGGGGEERGADQRRRDSHNRRAQCGSIRRGRNRSLGFGRRALGVSSLLDGPMLAIYCIMRHV
jgi:hypothetical protein